MLANIKLLKTESDEQIKIQLRLKELESEIRELDLTCSEVDGEFQQLLQ